MYVSDKNSLHFSTEIDCNHSSENDLTLSHSRSYHQDLGQTRGRRREIKPLHVCCGKREDIRYGDTPAGMSAGLSARTWSGGRHEGFHASTKYRVWDQKYDR